MPSSHFTRAIMATISSTAFPRVAFMRPASVCPTRSDNSSVANANSLARGIIERNENMKTSVSVVFDDEGKAKCRAHETGMHNRRIFNQDASRIAFRLLSTVGAGASGLLGLSIIVAARLSDFLLVFFLDKPSSLVFNFSDNSVSV
jgi:hypothetical protein